MSLTQQQAVEQEAACHPAQPRPILPHPCPAPPRAVVASEKGVVVGRLSFREDGDLIDCQRMGVGGKAIPPNIDKASALRRAALCCAAWSFPVLRSLPAAGSFRAAREGKQRSLATWGCGPADRCGVPGGHVEMGPNRPLINLVCRSQTSGAMRSLCCW